LARSCRFSKTNLPQGILVASVDTIYFRSPISASEISNSEAFAPSYLLETKQEDFKQEDFIKPEAIKEDVEEDIKEEEAKDEDIKQEGIKKEPEDGIKIKEEEFSE
jgi:hypothetical protein